jgi:hypothetical protein
MRHWQPLLSRYNNALKTSYKSTVVGFVRLRTDSSKGRICANCSRLISLGYGFLCFIPKKYRPQQVSGNNYLDAPGRPGSKIVNRLLSGETVQLVVVAVVMWKSALSISKG